LPISTGWGDEGFYRHVPTVQSLTVALALRALFRQGNPSVLHVVGIGADPPATFGSSDLVRIELSEAGFARLADRLDASFARGEGGRLPDERARPPNRPEEIARPEQVLRSDSEHFRPAPMDLLATTVAG
jgi:uncharacterized protein DUF2459